MNALQFASSCQIVWVTEVLKACLCNFAIQIITTEEAERRGHVYDREGTTYLFDLDYVDDEYTVDAAHYGNISHFVNHSVSVKFFPHILKQLRYLFHIHNNKIYYILVMVPG